jgi:hypothetical protein
VPTILSTTVRPVDETSESASSSSDTEDRDPPVLAPERPWSPSVPAALSTRPLRRHNIRNRRTEQADTANGTTHRQPSLSTQLRHKPSSPTHASPTPLSPSKTGPSTSPKSNVTSPFVSGGFVTGFAGRPFSPPISDEDRNKVHYQHTFI